ncbi:MAG: protein BatD [Chitinophagaceae bacterium]|nr:protein BatD [Chitinophagaceae bacterium]MCW5928427.1 protein BatD [Chitinophagaceae bacterium]
MKLIRKYLLKTLVHFFLLFCTVLNTLGQVRVHASVNKRSISQNDLVTIQFNIDNATEVEQFIPPSFSRCKIVQGPMHVTGSSTINGVESSYVSFVYVLQPLSEGKYSFSGASARVAGNRYSFNSVSVTVNEGDPGYPQGSRLQRLEPESRAETEMYKDYILYEQDDLHDKIRKNLFIKVDVNKSSCYEGEPVVASYKLYTRLHSESKISRRPSFNGFSVYDMVDPTTQPSSVEKLNGKDFNVYLIRKAQLFPLQSGMLELDAAEVENSINFIRAEYAMKDRGEHLPDILRHFEADKLDHEAIANEKVSIRSNPVTVKVKSLPEENKPASFNGAVGKFSIEANIDKKKVAVNDVATLKVIVKGEGNFCIMNAPPVNWPTAIEAYEPSSKEDFLKSVVPLRGYKTFQFTFMPKEEGRLMIPPVEFSYFDVDANRYKTLKTDSIEVNALPAENFAKEMTIAESAGTTDIGENIRVWIIAGSVVLLLLLGYLLYRNISHGDKKNAKPVKPELSAQTVKENTTQAEPAYKPDPLFNARLMLIQQNDRGFYSTLHKALIDFTAKKMELPGGSGKIHIEHEFKARGWDDEFLSQLQLVLQQCEEALYTPGLTETDMQSLYDLADDYLQSFDKA